MNKTVKALLFVAGMVTATSASATSMFNFSYNFYSGDAVTGSFSGYQIDGAYKYISNVSMLINGVAIGGPLNLLSQHTVLGYGGYDDIFQIIGSDGGFSITNLDDYGDNTTPDNHYENYFAQAYWPSGGACEGRWAIGNHGGPLGCSGDQHEIIAAPFSGSEDWFDSSFTSDSQAKLDGMGSLSLIEVSNDGIPPPAPVPLPAALPLMLSGLGVLGFASRRRKNTAV